MSFEAESNSELTVIVLAYQFPISGAKQNTQTKNFVGTPGQYYRSLWFSARSVQRISKSLPYCKLSCNSPVKSCWTMLTVTSYFIQISLNIVTQIPLKKKLTQEGYACSTSVISHVNVMTDIICCWKPIGQ